MTLLTQHFWESDEAYDARVERAEAEAERREERRAEFVQKVKELLFVGEER